MPCILPLSNKAAIKREDIADLALKHRQAIEATRTVSYVQAWSRHITALGRPTLPSRRLGHDSWICTNQVLGCATKIFFGAPTVRFFCFFAPLMPDHAILINRVSTSAMPNLRN